MDDKHLNHLLHKRDVPEMRSNLCERIVMQARVMREEDEFSLRDLLAEFLQAFILPRPALSLATIVLFGLLIGAGLDVEGLLLSSDYEVMAGMSIGDDLESEFEVLSVR